jgi:hypothetical protein
MVVIFVAAMHFSGLLLRSRSNRVCIVLKNVFHSEFVPKKGAD